MKLLRNRLAVYAAAGLVVGAGKSMAGCSDCGASGAAGGGACPVASLESGSGATAQKAATISTAGLAALLRAKTPVVVLDARSGKWDDGKRVPGAKAVNVDSSDSDIAAAAPDKAALVVTYCAGVKCPASGKLAAKLRTAGYANVIEYPEGIAGWLEAGNSIEETKK